MLVTGLIPTGRIPLKRTLDVERSFPGRRGEEPWWSVSWSAHRLPSRSAWLSLRIHSRHDSPSQARAFPATLASATGTRAPCSIGFGWALIQSRRYSGLRNAGLSVRFATLAKIFF